nr:C-type lectin-like [Pogona vitticeps]
MKHCLCLLLLAIGSALAFVKVTSDGSCAKQWTEIGVSCYRYFSKPMTFEKADLKCKTSFSSRLASIHSKEEACSLAKFAASQKPKANIWIGLTDLSMKFYVFQWTDRTRFNLEAWEKGQPAKKPKEHCAQLLSSSGFLRWGTKDCDIPSPYICKYTPHRMLDKC